MAGTFAGERSKAMKTIRFRYILPVIALITSCSSTYYPGSTPADDVYYSPRNNPAPAPVATAPAPAPNTYSNNNSNYEPAPATNYDNTAPDYSSTNRQYDDQGNTYVTNNYYYDQDDYYDYAYSANIRRFYSPVVGYSYYDPFYTNLYWYDYNPVHWGTSIYLGYNWWAPSTFYYQPFCYSGISIGIGWNNWGWGGWGWNRPWAYDPWYGPSWGWNNWGWGGGWNNGYWNGYNNGYWNGYYDGLYAGTYGNPYYYNSYDNNSWYYGPRGAASTNSPGGNAPRPYSASIGQKYEQAVTEGRVTPELPSRGSQGGFGNGASRPDPAGLAPSKQPVSGTPNDLGRPSAKPTQTPNPGFSRPTQGIISDKNQNGPQPSKGSTEPARPAQQGNDFGTRPGTNPTKGETQGRSTTPSNNNFGTRPGNEAPSKGNGQTQPANPSNNGFGTRPAQEQNAPSKNPTGTRPNDFSSPSAEPQKQPNNPGFQPAPSQPKRNEMKGERRDNSFSQPSGPRMESRPEPEPRNVTPKNSPSGKNRFFDFRSNGSGRDDRGGVQESRPRQEKSSPTFQPRNEPKQFSQPNPSPRSSPSPSRPSNNSGGNNKRR